MISSGDIIVEGKAQTATQISEMKMHTEPEDFHDECFATCRVQQQQQQQLWLQIVDKMR
jgi:hypothetical protein